MQVSTRAEEPKNRGERPILFRAGVESTESWPCQRWTPPGSRRDRAVPARAARVLLPDDRIGARSRGSGPGDLRAGVAGIRAVRGTVVGANLAVPDRHQRVPDRRGASAPACAANRARAAIAGPLRAGATGPVDVAWLEPVPDRLVIDERADPAEVVGARQSVRLALVAGHAGPPAAPARRLHHVRGAVRAGRRSGRDARRVGRGGEEPASTGPGPAVRGVPVRGRAGRADRRRGPPRSWIAIWPPSSAPTWPRWSACWPTMPYWR